MFSVRVLEWMRSSSFLAAILLIKLYTVWPASGIILTIQWPSIYCGIHRSSGHKVILMTTVKRKIDFKKNISDRKCTLWHCWETVKHCSNKVHLLKYLLKGGRSKPLIIQRGPCRIAEEEYNIKRWARPASLSNDLFGTFFAASTACG